MSQYNYQQRTTLPRPKYSTNPVKVIRAEDRTFSSKYAYPQKSLQSPKAIRKTNEEFGSSKDYSQVRRTTGGSPLYRNHFGDLNNSQISQEIKISETRSINKEDWENKNRSFEGHQKHILIGLIQAELKKLGHYDVDFEPFARNSIRTETDRMTSRTTPGNTDKKNNKRNDLLREKDQLEKAVQKKRLEVEKLNVSLYFCNLLG